MIFLLFMDRLDLPIVSVIIPCFNHAKYLGETLDSLLAQTLINWEAIIVNDGSTDNTEDIALAYVERDNRIQYFYQENSKTSAARNKGISHSLGKYILPLDGDDKIAPEFLNMAVRFLEENPSFSAYYSLVEFFGSKQGVWDLHYSSYKNELLSNSIHISTVFRKTDCMAIGGFDESMRVGLEDWEFFIRLLYPDKKIYQEQKVLAYYRVSDKGDNRNSEALQQMDLIEKEIVRKHIDKYIEYWGNPLSIYRECMSRRTWMGRRLPKLLFNILAFSQRNKIGPFFMIKNMF